MVREGAITQKAKQLIKYLKEDLEDFKDDKEMVEILTEAKESLEIILAESERSDEITHRLLKAYDERE